MQHQYHKLEDLIKIANSYPNINIYLLVQKIDNKDLASFSLPENLILVEETNPESLNIQTIREVFKINSLQKLYSLVFSTLWLARTISHYKVLKKFTKTNKELAFIIEDKALLKSNFVEKFKHIVQSLPQDKEIVLTQGCDFFSYQEDNQEELKEFPNYEPVNDNFKTISLSSYFIKRSLAKRISKIKKFKSLINDLTHFTSFNNMARIDKNHYLTDSSSYYLREVGNPLDTSKDSNTGASVHLLTYRYAIENKSPKHNRKLESIKSLIYRKLFQIVG